MATSLLQPSSSSSSTMTFSSSSSSLFTGSSHAHALPTLSFVDNCRARILAPCSVKCDMSDSSNFPNGKPIIPVLNERTLPKFLESARAEKTVSRNSNRLKLFSGTANPVLSQRRGMHQFVVTNMTSAEKAYLLNSESSSYLLYWLLEIARYMGLELGQISIKRFADGEIYVQLQESVRGCNVYLIQPTCPPANENLMELKIMIDACRRASAKNITAVIPYFGYARADRKTQGRESIAAKLVANLITKAGADRVLACDLHSGQSMGYFDIPVDHVHCQPVILDYLASKTISSSDLVVVSPDVGGVARARAFAKKLSDAPLAIVDKRRHGHNVAEVMNLIGDVKGKVAVMVDDMIDTAGTIAKGAALLHEEGAREVYACCTHAVFRYCLRPPAIERLSSGLFQEVIITNTIPVTEKNYFPQLTILTVANLLGETIWRIHDDSSVSSIFQ
ncbi:hypothetical protein V8G54_003085 [Vigna mungo]|uniref:ribose-phosphate diphosphokinase n=1 Tax=Vigna mungo TaxID=3915 RepID=A0AAQ3SDD1_VIGMU